MMHQSVVRENNLSKMSEPKGVYKVRGQREDSIDTSKQSKNDDFMQHRNPNTDRVLEFFKEKNTNDSGVAHLSYEDHTGKNPFEQPRNQNMSAA